MQTQTFPCPFCGRRMGVGIELLGRNVRCPHCKQVVLAPAPAQVVPAAPSPPAPPPVAPPLPPPPVAPVAVSPPDPVSPAIIQPPRSPAYPTPAAPPPDMAGSPAPAPQLPDDLPVFKVPQKEALDSIFGEPEDEGDEIFATPREGRVRVPEMPAPVNLPPAPTPVLSVSLPPAPPPSAPLPPPDENPFAGFEAGPSDPAPVPAPVPPLKPPAQAVPANPGPRPAAAEADPFADLAPAAPAVPAPRPVAMVPPPATAVPVVASPPPAPHVPAVVPVGPVPGPSAGANPWAGLDAMVTAAPAPPPVVPVPVPVPMPVPVPAPTAAAEELEPAEALTPESPRTRRSEGRARVPAASAGRPGALIKVGFFMLLPYALLMTGLAVYGLFIKSGAPAGHPLSTIPDDFGEFKPAERKKVSKLSGPLDGPLPPELTVALGNKLAVGQLEIEPVRVEQRGLKIISEGKGGGASARYTAPPTPPALVLHLKVKNTSDDLLIHPLDPAFDRRSHGNDRPGTGLVVGKQTFWGGAIEWPFSSRVERKYEAAQEADATPLKPGETREYVVFTDADKKILKAVRDARDAVLWRVQVRRGRIEYRGKDVPVTAVIGVEFKPTDVAGAD